MKQITFKQYRAIDITILCILTAVFEIVATYASNYWFSLQAMAISITLTMTCITMMRWSQFAVLPSFIGALVYCVSCRLIGRGGTLKQFFIYCVGSLFCFLPLILLNKLGKEKTRADFFRRFLFVTSVYISVILGKWLCSLVFEISVKSLIAFFTTDILSWLFALFIMSFAKSVDGLIEDQKSYLLRLDKERKAEQSANLNDHFD